ncbi:histidine kinase [Vibrionales bacterium C3R12]|nr:histidine kinase [Vibrionales bacterium C3R12]
MYEIKLDRLIDAYFCNSERRLIVNSGDVIIHQDGHNERLYYVCKGELEGFFQEEGSNKQTHIFTATERAFIGVHSFFSGSWVASSTVRAKTDVELAWIDRDTAEVDPETFGPLTAQFAPVIVDELSRRQRRATQEALEKEKALQKLNTAEQMTTLGQLAAGIAHELNNAIGVVSSKSERLEDVVIQLLEEVHPEASGFFDYGLVHGQNSASSDVRKRGKHFEQQYGLSKSLAKDLARAVPEDVLSSDWLSNPEQAVKYWQIGRDLHDMRLATRHTVGIVKSVKQLGRADVQTEELFDVNDSINKAVSLLQSDLRRVSVRMSPAALPRFKGSSTELVQVWANLMKNACDAMNHTDEPEIDIQTRVSNQKILITISNNGPEIDEVTRRKIFQPNFTTKKGGLSFGLGLGLSIVKRIISGYGGTIAVKSDSSRTIFRIKLPIEGDYGEA